MGPVARLGCVQFKGLLPVVQAVLLMFGHKLGELLHHLVPKHLQAFHRLQGFAHMHRHRHLQNAGCAGVDRQDLALLVEQDNPRRQVVQHGLQMASRQVHLGHAALYGAACV